MNDEIKSKKLSRDDVKKATEIVLRKLKDFFLSVYPSNMRITKSEYLEYIKNELWIIGDMNDFERIRIDLVSYFELNYPENISYLRDVSKQTRRDIILDRLDDTLKLAEKEFGSYLEQKVPREAEIIPFRIPPNK